MEAQNKRSAKINCYFQEHGAALEKRLIELVTEMVKQRTVNVIPEKLPEHPYLKVRGEEYRVAEIVKRELTRLGIAFEEFARQKERPNVIGRLGNNPGGKRLLLPAHMDVVPAGDGWDHDPFEVVVKDGRLYGRGTNDNKGPLAAILLAAEVIKRLELDSQMNGQMLIAALADEEAADPDGIDYGIGYLLNQRLIDPTHAIVPDIGYEMKEIDIAEKGRMVVRITALGQQAHASTPEKGINAIFMMAKLIQQLDRLRLEYQHHPILGGPTLNLGEIHGGIAANVVPASCSIYLDIRTVPGMSQTSVLRQIRDCIDRIPDGKFQIETLSESIAFSVSPDNDLVKLIQKYTQSELGFTATPMGMGGGTYAKNLIQHGVLTVGWGPGGDTAHMANEFIEIQQLMDFARLIALIATDLLQ